MSDKVILRKSRNLLSSFLHVLLNILLGVGSVFITFLSGTWIFGVLLVLLSKWRIFAVRPRYLWLNIKSNLVDLIVGISFVLIAYISGTTLLPIHFILSALYTFWLLFLKPKRSDFATEFQSIVAVFLGTTAAVLLIASSTPWLLEIIIFFIGYSAMRHTLIQSSDTDFAIIPVIVGLLSAELTWALSPWLIVYSFNSLGIIIPQLSILLTLLVFTFNRTYHSIVKHDGTLSFSDIYAPVIFCILVSLVIFLGFSKPIFNV
ncbi:MAG: hypothetical protein Q4F60_03495 [Candidatus Saccharibacteria bacterium]|nr:hypothetical protein [Candidatus Saccharibacteria bacterium]